jgi:EAL domain-containing protein (putative c-di-GMP-specific phosphodiesterase class I)
MAMRRNHSRPLGSVVRGAEARVAYLRAALLDNRLRLVAQPIVDVHTGETLAEELLLRVVRRNGQVEPPGPYIQAAEHSRLAIQVDTWVLHRAARLAAAGRHLHMNLSGRTVAHGAFADEIEAALDRHGAAPSLLTFEITETAPVLGRPEPGAVAQRIAALGCGLALDDFGMGYGALTYLHRLPVTMLKIDREFVTDVVANRRSRAILEAVVCIANRVGQTTVAEGVEDAATLAALRRCGVDMVQGFHLGQPAPA